MKELTLAAKSALDLSPEIISIPYTDFFFLKYAHKSS